MSARRFAFLAAVLAALGLAGLFSAMVGLMNVLPGGFMGMAHFTQPAHRVHDVTFALLNGTALIGMLAQLRAPARNMAAQLMALVPIAALALAAALTNRWVLSPPWLLLGVTVVFATMFHPAGDPLRPFRGARADRLMLVLVGAAAVPILAYAWTNVGLQRAGPSDHALEGHYGYMAALAFTVIGVGLLATARPEGWRITAWVAAAPPAFLGATSLLYPDVASSLAWPWALAAVGWGVAFAAAAERAGRVERGAGEGVKVENAAARAKAPLTRR